MMKIDYLLKTQKGSKIDEHHPRDELKSVNGNILLVQGPSSTGKSTVMNMIALGSYGEFNENLSRSVIDDLKELSSASYRDLSFDIELHDDVTDTRLKMSKTSGKKNIKVVEIKNGKESFLSKESFDKKYRLIYDVPENPTKRLEQIRETIKNENREASKKTGIFMEYVDDLRTAAGTFISEDKIEQDKKQVEELDALNKGLEDQKSKYDLKKMQAECALLCKQYQSINSEIEKSKGIIAFEEKKPESKVAGQKQKESLIKDFESKRKNVEIVNDLRNSIIHSRNDDLINKLKELDKLDLESDRYNIFEYRHTVEQMRAITPTKTRKITDGRIIRDLIEVLEKSKADMPLGSLGNAGEVLSALREYQEHMSMEFDYSEIRSNLKKIIEECEYLEKIENDILKLESSPDTPCRNEFLIGTHRNKIQNNKRVLSKIVDNMRQKSINIDKCEEQLQDFCMKLKISITTKENELDDIINDYETQSKEVDNEITTNKREIFRLQKEISDNEGKEKPKHYEDKNYLIRIEDACNKIRGRLKQANERLTMIEQHRDGEYKSNPELYQSIWDYIGYKLGTIRDCGTIYKVKSVDLFKEGKGDIEAENGVIIHIGAMGTGEGQLSYLRGLLSSDDDRMSIILFDEIGNMSSNLVNMLINDLKDLHKQGKLMLAFMASPNKEEFEVKVYE